MFCIFSIANDSLTIMMKTVYKLTVFPKFAMYIKYKRTCNESSFQELLKTNKKKERLQ